MKRRETLFAEIITIGEELLIGEVVDTNSTFIAKKLNSIGVEVLRIVSVPDKDKHIIKAIKEVSNATHFIFLTGGLGPTNDDVTKNTLCNYFNDNLIENLSALKNIENVLARLGVERSELNLKQAEIPSSAELLPNKIGTASGLWFAKKEYTLISLPGVPIEMKHIIKESVIPKINHLYNTPYISHKTVYVQIPESQLANDLVDFEKTLPSNFSLAYLPSTGQVALRIYGKGTDKISIDKKMDELIKSLYQILETKISHVQEFEKIENIILREFTNKKMTLCTSESCTAGGVSSRIASVKGASQYFKGGMVCYDATMKTSLLGIDKNLIAQHSTVSSIIAEEMAVSTKKIFDADYAISITGNAGPEKDKGSDSPIGTVFIGIASPTKIYSKKFYFGEYREEVINRAISKSLDAVLQVIREKIQD